MQHICFEVAKEFHFRPREVYENWDYNEVLSSWLVIKEKEYQNILSQVEKKDKFKYPPTLLIRATSKEEKEKQKEKQKELFDALNGL